MSMVKTWPTDLAFRRNIQNNLVQSMIQHDLQSRVWAHQDLSWSSFQKNKNKMLTSLK